LLFLLLFLLLYLSNLLFKFERFRTKMQVALDDKNVSSLDATLEFILPGVHQRFMAMEGYVKQLDRGMISCFEKLETMVQEGF
jgi:hypothetical protein